MIIKKIDYGFCFFGSSLGDPSLRVKDLTCLKRSIVRFICSSGVSEDYCKYHAEKLMEDLKKILEDSEESR